MALGVLAVLATALVWAGVAGAAPFAGAELEFAGDTAGYEGGQVAVPVECIGGRSGFCSGALTLSARGKKSTSTFSVQTRHRETVLVPLPTDGTRREVIATATTSQPFGPPVTRRAVLHLR